MKHRYVIVSWLLAGVGAVWLNPTSVCGAAVPASESSIATLDPEMALVDRAVTEAEVGNVASVVNLLCAGGDPDKTGWRVITVAWRLRENSRYDEANRLADLVQDRLGKEKSGPSCYWAARLNLEILDRPKEAARLLGLAEADGRGGPEVAELRDRIRVRVAALRGEEGGRQ